MKLNEIFQSANGIEISQLVDDSRIISNRGLYFARKGFKVNGHAFIKQAIENGAVAIVHSDEVRDKIAGIEYVLVDDVVSALHHAADVFFDYPSKKLRLHGITGTNGKTTTAKTLYNLLRAMGKNAGYIGTVSVEYGDIVLPPTLSTPDIIQMRSLLHDMVLQGVSDACIEVSSQGLDLRRIEGLTFYDKSFTNLTQDHLDYHKTMESYFKAKASFFLIEEYTGVSIVNIDNPYGKRLASMALSQLVTYGIHEDADYRAKDIIMDGTLTSFTLVIKDKQYHITTPFSAIFNVYNVLNVIAILCENGYHPNDFVDHLKHVKGVEGRLEAIDEGQDFKVYIDYAHSPDSMQIALNFLSSIKKGRLITVFGADGERDALKRPDMGLIASNYSDHLIVTKSNSRSEETADIINALLEKVTKNNYEIVLDRKAAISKAITSAQKDDIVVILGHGRDIGITIGNHVEDYLGDHIYARNVLKGERYENK